MSRGKELGPATHVRRRPGDVALEPRLKFRLSTAAARTASKFGHYSFAAASAVACALPQVGASAPSPQRRGR
jgi:hypothetical protein